MLDPRFREAETQYHRLRAEYDAGALTKEAYEAALRAQMIEHEGRYWAIAANSGRWFVSEGQSWVAATPPGMEPPPAGLPEDAPPAHPPAPVPAAPSATPQPRAAAAPARRGPNAALLAVGLIVLAVGLSSGILPLLGIPFRPIRLFGGRPVVALAIAGVGVILTVIAFAAGRASPAAAQPAPRPSGGSGAPPAGAGGTAVSYQRPSGGGCGGCLIAVLIAIAVVVGLLIAAYIVFLPKLTAALNTLQTEAQSAAATQPPPYSQPQSAASGLPACPEGYSPPRVAQGLPEPPPTCDPTLPPVSDATQ